MEWNIMYTENKQNEIMCILGLHGIKFVVYFKYPEFWNVYWLLVHCVYCTDNAQNEI